MTPVQRPLNPIQIHLLEMFSHSQTPGMMDELRDVLADFYARKVQAEADRMWAEGTLDEAAIDHILNEHWRTPYSQA